MAQEKINLRDQPLKDGKRDIGSKKIFNKGYPHKTFAERMEGYEGDYKFEEWDTGKPVGEEIF